MQLGALIARLDDENDAALALDALGDVALFARVLAMGEQFDEAPGEYVAGAARRFAALANDEDWLALMNALERANEPGKAVIKQILRWSLGRDEAELNPEPPKCGCSHGGGCHEHA